MDTQGNDGSRDCAVSDDGRFVVFDSQAGNLVPGDTNGATDVFVRDRVTGTTIRVSVTSDGQEGDRDSKWPDISSDGRFVAFESEAANLTPGDAGDSLEVFVHDMSTGGTEIVSVNDLGDRGVGWSWKPTISADGRFVAFASDCTNLVPDDTNDHADVFVYDRDTRQIQRVSVSSEGVQGNANSGHDWARAAISDDGRCVAFVSDASNLVPGDTNGVRDVFVHDRETGGTERVSVSSAGEEGNGPCELGGFTHGDVAINGDGRFVAFVSHASNLVAGDTNGLADVFVRDRATDSTERVSVSSQGEQADDQAYDASISADGRFVAFASHAHNLTPGYATGAKQIYLRDRETQTTHLVSVRPDGQPSLYDSMHPSVTPDGHFVCMASEGSDLVPADTNATWDILVHDRVHTLPFSDIACLYWAGGEITACVDANVVSGYPDGLYRPTWSVSRDQMAAFVSRALAGGDENVPEPPTGASFTDVPLDHWAYDYIEYAAAENVVQGYPAGDYRPLLDVTRGQMAVYVARAMVAPYGEDGLADYIPADPRSFPDVPSDHWAYTHVEYCVENDIVSGYGDGLYHPESVVTRDQMAVYIARAFDLPT
jgi:Tol biopolymer transport system component